MKVSQRLRKWFPFLFRNQRLDAEMDEEIRSHIELRSEENVATGMNPCEARQTALRQFGWMESVKDNCRDQRRLRWMENLGQDIRFGARQLGKNPGFATVAVVTLALGVGAITAIFSVVHAVLLNPLPFPASDRLVWLSERVTRSQDLPISYPDFIDWRNQQTVFDQIGVYNWGDYNLDGIANPRRLRAAQMSASALDALQAHPALGRVFREDEDKPGAPHVVLLSHALWQEEFGGSPAILHQLIHLDGNAYTVVGIMPAGFVFPDPVDIWVPLGPLTGEASFQIRGSHPGLEGVGRLKPRTTLNRARTEMDTIAARLAQQYPKSNEEIRVLIEPLLSKIVGNVSRALWMLLGAVALVLLIACANVANLLLARAVARQKEMALRVALGASQWRILQQLLTESLLLAALGSALGLLLAHWGLALILASSRYAIPRAAEIQLDGGVLAFTAAAALCTGIGFGLAPAWRASRPAVQTALQDTARSVTDGHGRLRQGLIVTEVALTLILLIGAILLLRSFHRLQAVNPGFVHERIASFRLDLPRSKYANPDQQNVFFQALLQELRTLPGVQAAAIASRFPLEPFNWHQEYRIEGQPEPPPTEIMTMDLTAASADYFSALGIPILKGRAFSEHDDREHLRGSGREQDPSAGVNVIIVDEEFARRHWPNQNPIGKRVQLPWDDNPVLTVVGVVARVKMRDLSEHNSLVQAYVPAWQLTGPGRAVIMRTSLRTETVFNAVREKVRLLDPQQPISSLCTGEELWNRSLAPQRLNFALLGLFAAVALALAVIGLYGVLSYAVTQRRREIGVRVALGAQRRSILGLVVGGGMRLVLLGTVLGLAAAAALTQVMENLLYEVNAFDRFTFVSVPLVLIAVGLLACWLPAWRAANINPMVALRSE